MTANRSAFVDDSNETRLAGFLVPDPTSSAGDVPTSTGTAGEPAVWQPPSGGFSPSMIVLGMTAPVDVSAHASPRHLSFDEAWDNTVDFNTITVVPAGLGLDIDITGGSPDITATEDGWWIFSLSPESSNEIVADATLTMQLVLGAGVMFAGESLSVAAVLWSYTEPLFLPSGTTTTFRADTLAAATAMSYDLGFIATIVRIA